MGGGQITARALNRGLTVSSTDWKKMDENLFCHHMQYIFCLKRAKDAKTRILPNTKLPLNDLEPLSTVSDQVP